MLRPFRTLFQEAEANTIEYKGKTVTSLYRIRERGEYELHFTFVSAKKEIPQAICLVMSYPFDGSIFVNGKEFKVPKKRFPRLFFWSDTWSKENDVKLTIRDEDICICNASLHQENDDGSRVGTYWEGYCALYMEKLSENKIRFYCNDHEEDDDFDDLIFDMEIVKFTPFDEE